jgi:hypothetical protein
MANPFLSTPVDHHINSAGDIYSLIFTNHLRSGETLSSVTSTTVRKLKATGTTAELTVTSPLPNAAEFDDDDENPVPVGHAIRATITGGIEGGEYTVEYKVATSASRSLIGVLRVSAKGDE